MSEAYIFQFESKNGKKYPCKVSKDFIEQMPGKTVFTIIIDDTPTSGYVFPILRNKNGLYVRWWYGLIAQFELPSDLKKHINKVIKLLVFI